MKTNALTAVLFLYGTANGQQAFDDCVLNNLKSANGNEAAAMVRQSCRSKTFDAVYTEYGEVANDELTADGWEIKGSKLVAWFKNPTPRTVTVVVVYAAIPEKDGACGLSTAIRFKARQKAGQRQEYVMLAPSGAEKHKILCLTATARLSRDGRLSDSFPSQTMVLSAADYDLIVNAYSAKKGSRFEP
jgi:hypothetical protein